MRRFPWLALLLLAFASLGLVAQAQEAPSKDIRDRLENPVFRRLPILAQLRILRAEFEGFEDRSADAQVAVLDHKDFRPESWACLDVATESSGVFAAALAEYRKRQEQEASDLPLVDQTLEEATKRAADAGLARVLAARDDFELHLPTIRELHAILRGDQHDSLYWELYFESVDLLARFMNEGGGEPPAGFRELEAVSH